MIRFRTRLDDRNGSALVLVVVAMLGILSMMALAIDMGMLRAAHGEAQRAADAAALAGASAFMDPGPGSAELVARDRAVSFAEQNSLHGSAFTPGETTVEVFPESATVRVTLRRPAVSTWFARIFGVTSAPVSARAAARATEAPSARCVKPFVPPDMWAEQDDDLNGNGEWDDGENWEFEPDQGDYYSAGGRSSSSGKPATGYGSSFRGSRRDRGRKIMLNESPLPGFANLWAMPDMDWGLDIGGAALRENIRGCNPAPVELGNTYKLESGIKAGPIVQGVTDLVERDPGARWDEAQGTVAGSSFNPWFNSPRLIRIPLHDPAKLQSKLDGVEFTRFAWVFLEPPSGPSDPVVARFVEIVRVLQLVE